MFTCHVCGQTIPEEKLPEIILNFRKKPDISTVVIKAKNGDSIIQTMFQTYRPDVWNFKITKGGDSFESLKNTISEVA